MGGKILLFGFDDLPSILAVGSAMEELGIETIPVARADYGKPLAVLAGLDDPSGPVRPYAGGPLGGRMLVFCGLDSQVPTLLPALAQTGVGPECLKAVLTSHNRTWDALTLFAELQRERRAIEGKV